MSMALTQLALTMVTVTCSWTGSMSTTMKHQVSTSSIQLGLGLYVSLMIFNWTFFLYFFNN